MGYIVVWIIAIIREGISKVAAATHGGGEGEGSGNNGERLGNIGQRPYNTTWFSRHTDFNCKNANEIMRFMRVYDSSPTADSISSDSSNPVNWTSSNPDFSRMNQSLGGSFGSGVLGPVVLRYEDGKFLFDYGLPPFQLPYWWVQSATWYGQYPCVSLFTSVLMLRFVYISLHSYSDS